MSSLKSYARPALAIAVVLLPGQAIALSIDDLKTWNFIAGTVYAILAFFVASALYSFHHRKTVSFFAECLFQETAHPRIAAFVALVQMMVWLRFNFISIKLEDLVRLRVEFDILKGKDLKDWREDLKVKADFLDKLKEYKPGATLNIRNCTDLVKSRDKIEQYFQNLPHLKISDSKELDPTKHFLWSVKIREGYVAAQHLVSGLLARYDEEWNKILKRYIELVKHSKESDEVVELVEVQVFQLNCWLLWGPSIPMCKCSEWTKGGMTLLQFGYGDECNSVCVQVESSDVFEKLQKALSPPKEPAAADRLALKVDNLEGRLLWSEAMELPAAQAELCAPPDSDPKRSYSPRPVIQFERRLAEGHESKASYYSAYLWVMFVICEGEKDLFFRSVNNDEKSNESIWWRNLLPFFEHGNIADASTLEFHKERLVAKTVSAAVSLLKKYKQQSLTLRYVCAFDDSFCVEGTQIEAKSNMRERLSQAIAALKPDQELERQEIEDIKARIVVLQAAPRGFFHNFVSCNLHTLIASYTKAIDEGVDLVETRSHIS